ncbi:MAG: HAD family hydrolase [archaeon]|nr:MAG: HAD family hydrolase [archaeon]
MKRLISFDLDQTLVDTISSHMASYLEVLKKNNLKVPHKSKLRKLIDGRHGRDLINALYPNLSKKLREKIRIERKPILKKHSNLMRPIPGAKKTLFILKRNYKLALITNAAKNEVNLFLKKSKIPKKIFDFILLGDQLKKPKPFPDGIIKVEHLLHVKSDIHVGDSTYDIISAKKAKAISVGVLTGQVSKRGLKRAGADFIIKSVADLSKLLSKNKL